MKKYDNYKDSGVEWIGKIPSHWDVMKFNLCVKIRHGHQFMNNDFTEDGVKIVKITQLHKNGYLDLSNCSFVKAERTEDFRDILIKENDILMCLTGGTIGKIIRVGTVNEPLLQNYRVGHFSSLIDAKICNDFIFWVMSSEYLVSQIFFQMRETGQPNIGMDDFGRMRITIPTLTEQITIANYLDLKTSQIDHLIAKKEQFIKLLEEERVAVINQAVTKGLDPNVPMKDSGVEWLGEIPEHWDVKRLKQIFNSRKGLTITKENLEDEGIPCVNYGEIHSKFGFEVDIDKHQLKCVNPSYLESDYKSLIKTGDFVFADTSEDLSGAGNFTYLKSNHEIFAGYHTIILRAFCDIEPRYFAYQFDSIPYRTQIRQSVKGIKVFSITQGILKNTSLWIPTLDEQKLITKYLDIETDRIVSIKNSTKKEIELLKEYKTALISEVVTGKVDVRNEILN